MTNTEAVVVCVMFVSALIFLGWLSRTRSTHYKDYMNRKPLWKYEDRGK